MNSEKVKEIKKALECMSGLCKDSLSSICFECEIDKKFDEESACKEALTLINELESENERLNKSDTSKEESSIEYYNLYKDLKRKNKDLNELCELQRVSISESFVRENQLKDRIAELENIGLNENITVGEYLREMQRLKDRIAELEKENNDYYERCVILRRENEQLKTLVSSLENKNIDLEEYIKGNEQDAKAFVNGWHKDLETELTQFAERLKEKLKARHEVDRLLLMPVRDVALSTIEGLLEDVDKTLKELINE